MGVYGLSGVEIEDSFLRFLKTESDGEGDISAKSIADAWNKIAKDMGWDDRLIAVDKKNIKFKEE